MFGHSDNDQQQAPGTGAVTAPSDDVTTGPPPPADFVMPGASTPPEPDTASSTPEAAVGDTTDSSPGTSPALADDSTNNPAVPDAGASSDLLNLKQQALQQLSPLVGHLDQTPEEKFRTTMMMIQASDNKDLIKDAYGAAQAITDDKARAQALLDVINEINYFTQHTAN